MAKFNVSLAVQYVVEAGNPVEAYNLAAGSFSNTQAKAAIADMASRFDGLSVQRLDDVAIESGD